MPVYSDEDYLACLQALRAELPELLPPAEAGALQARLDERLRQAEDPARRAQAITLALDEAARYDAARQRLKALLEGRAGKEAARWRDAHLGYEPSPGEPQPIPLGARVECSQDPAHWRGRLRVHGERCPVCNEPLKPVEDLAEEED